MGGFIFGQEILRLTKSHSLPCGTMISFDDLTSHCKKFNVDSLFCLPSFAFRFFQYLKESSKESISIRNIYYLGESFSIEEREYLMQINPKLKIRSLAYTTQETGLLGFQCSHIKDNQFHLFSHVKILKPQKINEEGEFEVLLSYPNQQKTVRHRTGDVVIVNLKKSCCCGYNGNSIDFKGRVASATNVFGTSIDANEIIRLIPMSQDKLIASQKEIQIISKASSKGFEVKILIQKKYESRCNDWESLFKKSSLIREIYADAKLVEICFVRKNQFLLNPRTKKQPFHVKTVEL